MRNTLPDIQPLTGFKRNSKALIRGLAKKPLVLTVNGEAAVVLLSPKAYQKLVEADETELLRQGLAEMDRGEGRDAFEVLEEMRVKYKGKLE